MTFYIIDNENDTTYYLDTKMDYKPISEYVVKKYQDFDIEYKSDIAWDQQTPYIQSNSVCFKKFDKAMYDVRSNWLNEYFAKSLKEYATSYYSPNKKTLDGFIPMILSPAPLPLLMSVNQPLDEDVFNRYPIKNTSWLPYEKAETTILNLSESQKTTELIEKTYNSGIRVFIALSRMVRDDMGHLLDPWNRSMHDYRANFNANLFSRQRTKMEANSCDELLVWEVNTTLSGTKVLLILWEEVKLSYARKKTIQDFLNEIGPYQLKVDKNYSV